MLAYQSCFSWAKIARHVGILSIQGSHFQITEIPLKTVRPFEMDEVVLTDMAEVEDHKINLEDKDTITAFLRGQVSYCWA